MEKLESSDVEIASVSAGFMQPSASFKGNDEDFLAYYERFVEDTDSFFDELNGKLMVSRMVSDSVIKGMVNAVSEEAAEIIAGKEAEIKRLSERLRVRELEISRLKMGLQGNDWKFRICKEESGLVELEWEWGFREEINNVVIQNFMEEYEGKLEEQRREYLGSLNRSWLTRIDEIGKLREELDVISRSILGPEPGQLVSHGSHEIFEESASNRKKELVHRKSLGHNASPALEKCMNTEDTSADIFDSLQLKGKSREDVISFFKTEITNLKRSHESNVTTLKRNHESKVGELTEEYFSLRRKISPFRKDKEFDSIRKRVPEIIMKLDSIIEENGKLDLIYKDYENICSSKNRLVLESGQLKDLLLEKEKEIRCLSSLVSDSMNKMNLHSVKVADLLKQIEKLESESVESEIEFMIREEIYMGFHRDFMGEIKCSVDDSDIETLFVQEVFEIIYREALRSMESKLLENEQNLSLEIGEKEQLKEQLVSISKLLEEKEKLASDGECRLRKQKEECELVSRKLKRQVDKTSRTEGLLFDKNREFELLKGRLEVVLQGFAKYEIKLQEQDHRIKVMADEAREARLQITLFDGIIQEQKQMISSKIANEREQRVQMQSIVTFFQGLSEALSSFECRVVDSFKSNNSRLEVMRSHIKPLVQQVRSLRERGLKYERGFKRKCSDLLKAENEVDLLGDQVDGFKMHLNNICFALDHYSHILQHYPGVMEIRKLVLSVLPEEEPPQPSSQRKENPLSVLTKFPRETNSSYSG